MTTFPLEDEKMNYDDDVTTVTAVENPRDIVMPALIIGIFLLLLGFFDMIILYVVPNNRIKENKRKLPNATFKKPNAGVIAVHFIIHILIMLFSVFLILYGLDISRKKMTKGLIALAVLTVACWIVELAVDFSLTISVKSKMTVNELIPMICKTPPIDFVFVYSSDSVDDYQCSGTQSNCEQNSVPCYSKTGVIIPLNSTITSPIYNFTNTPNMFYFTYEKKLTMSSDFSLYFNNIMGNINMCDPQYKKVTDFYPLVNGTYIVSYEKIPTCLTKATRIASILFGVGIYYELSSKSIPYLTYNQGVYADVAKNIDYNNIFTSANCQSYGRCSIYNKKPSPY